MRREAPVVGNKNSFESLSIVIVSFLTSFFQCSQFRIVPTGKADIFRTSVWNGTKMTSFHTGLNISSTGSVSTVPAEIPDFGWKMDTGPKQKRKFFVIFHSPKIISQQIS